MDAAEGGGSGRVGWVGAEAVVEAEGGVVMLRIFGNKIIVLYISSSVSSGKELLLSLHQIQLLDPH